MANDAKIPLRVFFNFRSDSFVTKDNPDGIKTLGTIAMDNDTVS